MTHHTLPNDDDPTPAPSIRTRRVDGLPKLARGVAFGALMFALGVLTAVATLIIEGDRRYPTRVEMQGYLDQAADLRQHAFEDKRDFARNDAVAVLISAVRDELHRHEREPAHPGVKDELSEIKQQLAAVRADLIWLKDRQRERGRIPP